MCDDRDGKTIGGHLVSGCKMYTAADIVLAAFPNMIYKREFAKDSGYEELVVDERYEDLSFFNAVKNSS